MGEALDWTDAEIDRMAEVTAEDVAAARAFWNRQAPPPMKRLLDAKPAKRTPKP